MNDISDDGEQEIDDNRVSRYRVFLAVVLVFIMVLVMAAITRKSTPDIVLVPQTAHSTYYRALEETHTGLRMARLGDFIENYSQSPFIGAARAQFSTLKVHEAEAWAVLSNTFYGLGIDEVERNQALYIYKTQWGALYRGGDIQALEEITIPSAPPSRKLVTALTDKPKYGGEKILAGASIKSIRDDGFRGIYYIKPVQKFGNRKLKVRRSIQPKYPRKAHRNGVGGQVVLSLDIDANGYVVQTQVISVSARRYQSKFVKAARRAAKRSRFYPRISQGRPVMTQGFLRTYTFQPGR